MAKEYLDKAGLTYLWGKLKAYLMRRNIVPEQSKTYTGVIASANDQNNGALYFMKIQPNDYYDLWSIKYRVTATMNGISEANGSGYESSEVYICGVRDTYSAYRAWNDISNSNYRPYYYHCFYRAKAAGINGGYGHALGIHLRYAYNPTEAANARTVTFEILETKGCTVTLLDAPLKYADWPGTGSTNYNTYSNFDATTYGWTFTGDRNDVNYYNRVHYSCRKAHAALYRYQLCLARCDGTMLPVNGVNNSIATNKTLTTESFDPFGEILFWQSISTVAANGNIGDNGFYRQYLCDFRYSFNIGGYDVAGTLVAREPVYLVASLQNDGSAKLHSSPLSQDLPSSADGLIYIYLGHVYPDTHPYRVYLSMDHPVYRYVNGAIREISSDSLTVNGHTVNSDVPANAKFTDTVPYGFGTVMVGQTAIAASSEEDTFNLIEGNNISFVPQNGGVVINAESGAQINKIFTAYSTTAAGTAAKVATLEDATGFSLAAGVRVAVRFQYGNTASTPTLNVNSSGAKEIAYPTSATGIGTGYGSTYNSWGPYETVLFTYNGSKWIKDATGLMAYAAYNAALNSMHWSPDSINLSGATQSDVDDLAYGLSTGIYYVFNAAVGFPESSGTLKVFNDNEEYTHWEFISHSSGNEYARTFSLIDADWVNSWKTLGTPFDIFQIKTYTYAYSNIAAAGSLNVTATNLGISTPTGYTPLAAQQVSSGNGNVVARTWDVTATGSTAAVALRNVATSAQSGTVTFKVVYVKSDSITT